MIGFRLQQFLSVDQLVPLTKPRLGSCKRLSQLNCNKPVVRQLRTGQISTRALSKHARRKTGIAGRTFLIHDTNSQ
ncbi:hypothetical protein ACM42_37425 [Bradyrhizobium sp. CCBAU 25338]|nr:hypothetical protein [Bradyrhizobium sp. CCBAU 25338]